MNNIAIKERPILFSAVMVRAILDGRKTQTRRVFKFPSWAHPFDKLEDLPEVCHRDTGCLVEIPCPYGKPGNRLWVRETFSLDKQGQPFYRADEEQYDVRWLSPYHMMREASRITLEVMSVKVGRVQAITRDDAKAEGVSNIWCWNAEMNQKHPEHFERGVLNPYIANFSVLWDAINAKRGFGWGANPWVWAIEFKRVLP